jgi:hypothetical protein
MRRRMRVATRNCRSGLCNALLRSHHVYDPLLSARQVKEGNSGFLAIAAQLSDHRIGQRIREWLLALVGRYDVVYRGERAMRIGYFQIEIAQHAKGLRTRDLMNEMRSDQQLRLAVRQRFNRVRVPYFFE